MHAIDVICRIGVNAQARVKTAILEKITGTKFAGLADLLWHVVDLMPLSLPGKPAPTKNGFQTHALSIILVVLH